MRITYQEYRKNTPLGTILNHSFVGYVSCIFSPFVSILCMKHNLRPNSITLLMIITGIIAGAVLILPSPVMKILSSLLYLLWFIFDCSDGEVARFTKNFSKGGKYLDWFAHLIAHPLFVVAMWVSLIQWQPHYIILTTISSFALISFELIGRNTIAIGTLYGNIENSPYSPEVKITIPYWVYCQSVYFPNALFLFPCFVGLSIIWGWNWFYWIYIGWAIYYSLTRLRILLIYTWMMYKSS